MENKYMSLSTFIEQTECKGSDVICLFENDPDLRVIKNCVGDNEFQLKEDAFKTYNTMIEYSTI